MEVARGGASVATRIDAAPVVAVAQVKKAALGGTHPTLPRAGDPLVAHRASQRGQSGEHSIASDIDEGRPFLSADGDGLHQAALYEQTPLGDAARASLERDIRDLGAAVDNIAAAGKASRQPVKMLGRRAAASLPTHGLCGSAKKCPLCERAEGEALAGHRLRSCFSFGCPLQCFQQHSIHGRRSGQSAGGAADAVPPGTGKQPRRAARTAGDTSPP